MLTNLFSLHLKKDKRVIPEIASFISNSAYKLGLSKRKTGFLCFTIETVLDYRMDEISDDNPEIIINVIDNGKYFKFDVTDFGAPYVLTKNQIAILNRKLVDKFSFEQNGRKGQTISFSYSYEKPILNYEEKTIKEELLDEEFNFNRVGNSDKEILEAIKCLYDTYGYDYYHQHLYSVENFRKYMSNGHYVPIIGTNNNSQTMCYCALDENTWFMGVPEFSNLVTKPIARGKGLATKIFKETEKIALDMKYEGIHVSAVAYHPYTQKMCNALGYTPSAVEYSINPKGTGGYDEDRRLDCVIGVKIFNKTKKHNLYLDRECNDLYSSIFENEHLNYEIINEGKEDIEDIISYVIDTDTANCFMKIDKCSKDIFTKLKELINSDEMKNVDVITVNLNMNIESSIIGYKALRSLGFISTGCIPGPSNGDYMLLQSFKEEPQYDKIVVLDNYQELIDKVLKLNGIDKKGK